MTATISMLFLVQVAFQRAKIDWLRPVLGNWIDEGTSSIRQTNYRLSNVPQVLRYSQN